MLPPPSRIILGCVLGAVLLVAPRLSAQPVADELCDPGLSTSDTCVIAAALTVVNAGRLEFSRRDLEVTGTLTFEFGGRCGDVPEARCDTDAECEEGDACVRTGTAELHVPGLIDVAPGGRILARGQVLSADRVGHDGSTLVLSASDVTIRGTVSAAATGRLAVPAGSGGTVVIDAERIVTLERGGTVDVSSSSGACGGRVRVGDTDRPGAVALRGDVSARAETLGGVVAIAAAGSIAIDGLLDVTNTSDNAARRPACADGAGGGEIALDGATVELTGRLLARGNGASGGTIRATGQQEVRLDSDRVGAALSVFGGDADAFTGGGEVTITATTGNVVLLRGAIEASGQSNGFGSDAGSVTIDAAGTPPTEGNVRVDVPITARGGSQSGFGCFSCEINAPGTVIMSGPFDVSGGGAQGIGGDIDVDAGDLVVGSGAVTSTGADGGIVLLNASSTLVVRSGTRIRADGRDRGGFGGDVLLEGCDLTIETDTSIEADAGDSAGSVTLEGRERLAVEALSTFSATPDGTIDLVARSEDAMTVSPDARFLSPRVDIVDPGLAPCPFCGNGEVDVGEECDGPGSCEIGETCGGASTPSACACLSTCGAVPGIQPGEECDGEDLGDRSCETEGFPGGVLACSPDCVLDTGACAAVVCGDGILGAGEACDPGGLEDAPPAFGDVTCPSLGFPSGGAPTCTPTCSAALTGPLCSMDVERSCLTDADCPGLGSCVASCFRCGNAFLEPGEICDAGDRNSDEEPDACRTTCVPASCGDGVLDADEECDPSSGVGSERPCTDACRLARCGDGRTCSAPECTTGPDEGPEQCDPGGGNAACQADCALPPCGNGVIDLGEECDDGNPQNDDGCDVNCTVSRCGNGIVNFGETCDAQIDCCVACNLASCDDGNPCTDDACSPVAGCTSTPVPERPCTDGDACTTGDRCTASGACEGEVASCDTGDPCRLPSCDVVAGCQATRPRGFAGIPCLGATDLVGQIDRLAPTLGTRKARRLHRIAARLAARLDRATALGPGRRAARRLQRARRDARALARRLARLRDRGRLDQGAAQALIDVVTGLRTEIDGLLASGE